MSETGQRRHTGVGLGAGQLVTVFGGSGFVGRHVVRALARRGYRIRAAMRRPNLALFLKPMGDVGQIELFQANIRDDRSCRQAMEGAAAVVNLVGILQETGRQRFAAVQAEGPARLARLASEAEVGTFVQMSAIGADEASASAYGRTKAAGENAVRTALADAVILRPSIVFGPEDDFFNRFAAMARLAPALPLIGGGDTRFQPVYVKNVADAVAAALEMPDMRGRTFELGGPEVLSFRALMAFILRETGRRRMLVPIPFGIATFMSYVMKLLPVPPLTPDQVELLKFDNVVSDAAAAEHRTLEGLGIEAASIEAIVPSYLYRFRRAGEFEGRSASSAQR